MGSYRLSEAAADDLTAIARYTVATHGKAQALAYRDGLIQACGFLADNPEAARLRTELEPPIRVHRFQSHMLVYKHEDDGSILIVRIRHVREDWISDPSGSSPQQ